MATSNPQTDFGTAVLRHHLAPLEEALANPATTEVVINRPCEFGVEAEGEWSWFPAPSLTYEKLDGIAMVAAGLTKQTLNHHKPTCSTILPGGLRVQIARPPALAPGLISFTIRKRATSFVPTLGWLDERGYFSHLPQDRDWRAWWQRAVEAKKTIALSGNTGSGKTTFADGLARAIPLDERLVIIEKTPELVGLPHRNIILRYYGSAGDGAASERAATEAVQDALRQRPDRILIGEIRSGGECWAWVRAIAAGHPGSIVTVHAGSAGDTVDTLALIMRQDASGATMPNDVVRAELVKRIDIIAHCARNPYRLTEVKELA